MPIRRKARLAAVLVALAGVPLAVEAVFRFAPATIPAAYRSSFPLNGLEFFHPGILDDVPVAALPLPCTAERRIDEPPADLIWLGMVPESVDVDRQRFQGELIFDELGLPNAEHREQADVVLVGDSYVVAAGQTRPPGLQLRLAEETGLTVHNVGVTSIGPERQLWLLENVGLPMRPRVVVWFFFPNDLRDVWPELQRRAGHTTYAEAFADQRPPRSILVDLISRALSAPPAAREPLPGLPLRTDAGGQERLWFIPSHLQVLTWSRAELDVDPGWQLAREALRKARKSCADAGAALVLVHVPTKAEVYLPYVEQDAELIHAMATFVDPAGVSESPQAFLADALAHRRDLEGLLRDFAVDEGLAFVSGTDVLEQVAQRGELAYYTADTHWHREGQLALLDSLSAAILAATLDGER